MVPAALNTAVLVLVLRARLVLPGPLDELLRR